MSEIHFNSASNKLEIFLSIFLDDLGLAFEEKTDKKIHLCTEMEVDEADDVLKQYVDKHFMFFENEQKVNLHMIGKEISDDMASVHIYLESETLDANADLKHKNSILHHLYSDQKNMTTISGFSEIEQSIILDVEIPFVDVEKTMIQKK